MNCEALAFGDLPSRYLLGELSDEEREAYEAHYFECDRCYRGLEILRSVQTVLARDPGSARSSQVPARVPRWLPVAAAVAAATTVVVWWRHGPGPGDPGQSSSVTARPDPAVSIPSTRPDPRVSELVQLARFEPPRYDPPRLRGVPSTEAGPFDRAMSHYTRGDYVSAIPGLEEEARLRPADPRAPFFLGVCFFATDRPDAAIRSFERVATAAGSPYDEEAWYLKAKAQIRRGELRAALASLDRTIALRGERAEDARVLRARLQALDEQGP